MDMLTFILSLVMIGIILGKYKKLDTLFFLLGLSIVVNCLGRFMLSSAQNLETAIWANLFLYVGGSYAPLLLAIVLFKVCNMRFPKIATIIMTAYSTIILLLVMSVGYTDLYYADVQLIKADGYSYLEKVYGPLHILYPIMMALYGIFLVVFVVRGIIHRKRISVRTVIGTGATGLVIISAYIIEQIIDLNITLMSVGYLIVMVFIIKFFDRINVYDMTANIVSFVENRGEFGYIVFDNKNRFISCNGYVAETFPEVKGWVVDSTIPVSDSPLYSEVVQFFLGKEWEKGRSKIINIDDKFFEINVRPIQHGKKHAGYVIEFTDRTLERKYYNSIENYNSQLEKEVAIKTADILHIKDMMVLGMADMVESRDNNTGGHIKRTSAIVKIFAEKLRSHCTELGISEKFLKQVEKAAPMHDLGKIAIDDAILRKPGKFTEEEFAEMKRHTTEGERIVTSILKGVEDDEFVEIARNVALYHHEKWNGKGYPMGIAGEEIPVEARIMALADVFDALVSKRCYKDAFSYDKAFSIIEEDLGTHFDPELGRIFLECREELIKSL
ncbi:MAG: HD domain-containing protein [Ruminiclostridium sp.]|nr:HD domain-containing protein [Ruminiclostridium sp.]